MIVVVGGIKGGTGKTTIAANLAVLRSLDKKKVLLVDADEQMSATIWSNQREAQDIKTNWYTIQLAENAILNQVKKFENDFDDIIIDVGGRATRSLRAAIAAAHIFLIPFKPRSLDIWTLVDIKTLIVEMLPANPLLKCFAIVNQADPKGADNMETMEILRSTKELECMDITIGCRKAFATAAGDGLAVCEMSNPDKKAIAEMQTLYDFIYTKCTCNV